VPKASALSFSQVDSEARTEELDNDDLARLETWGAQYQPHVNIAQSPASTATDLNIALSETDHTIGFTAPTSSPASEVKFEAGLRICPRCKKPVHLGAANCRECGTSVPRQ
jgi:hypothetical protein